MGRSEEIHHLTSGWSREYSESMAEESFLERWCWAEYWRWCKGRSGLERWVSHEEHLMLFHRTYVQFPGTTWDSSSPLRPALRISCPLWPPEVSAHIWQKFTQTYTFFRVLMEPCDGHFDVLCEFCRWVLESYRKKKPGTSKDLLIGMRSTIVQTHENLEKYPQQKNRNILLETWNQ